MVVAAFLITTEESILLFSEAVVVAVAVEVETAVETAAGVETVVVLLVCFLFLEISTDTSLLLFLLLIFEFFDFCFGQVGGTVIFLQLLSFMDENDDVIADLEAVDKGGLQ